jgi:hypothetical protein
MAFDQCHFQIVHALEKEGWTVANKQTRLYSETRQVFIDIYAEKRANGSAKNVLLSEVKCFAGSGDNTREIYTAIGQYLVYRSLLAELQIAIPLYLAIPLLAYESLFEPAARRVVQESRIKLLIVNVDTEEVAQWID